MKAALLAGVLVLVAVGATVLFAAWQLDLFAGHAVDELRGDDPETSGAAPGPAAVKGPQGVQPQPIVAVDVTEYDFGQARNHAKGFRHAFVFRNEGSAPLEIRDAEASCTKCTSFELPKAPIPPGGSAELIVKWDVETLSDTFRQSIKVFTTDKQRPQVELVITGKVQQVLRVVPAELVLSKVLATTQSEAKVRLLAYFSDNLEVSDLKLASPPKPSKLFELRQAAVPPAELGDARSGVDIFFTVKPGLPTGAIREKIRLKTNLSEERHVEIAIRGRVTSDISVIGQGWAEDSGTLILGSVSRQKGIHRTLNLLVRGPHQEGLALEPPQTDPDSLQVTLGEAVMSGQVTRIPLTIDIPPGSPPLNRMGGDGRLGQIIISTNSRELGKIILHVQFAIEG
ncbi:MAG: DUF1573 domain-containing protein [Pirellulales bacterium]